MSMQMRSSADSRPVCVYVSPGIVAGAFADMLEQEGIIRSSLHFKWFNRIYGADTKLQAGNYLLSTDLSLPDIVRHMQHGQVEPVVVTIPGGLHLRQIAEVLAAKELVDRQRFRPVAHGETLV